MTDRSRIAQCLHCEKWWSHNVVEVKCPYCDKTMVFSLPEYEFYDGPIICEHCHKKSHLRLGVLYLFWVEGSHYYRAGLDGRKYHL